MNTLVLSAFLLKNSIRECNKEKCHTTIYSVGFAQVHHSWSTDSSFTSLIPRFQQGRVFEWNQITAAVKLSCGSLVSRPSIT